MVDSKIRRLEAVLCSVEKHATRSMGKTLQTPTFSFRPKNNAFLTRRQSPSIKKKKKTPKQVDGISVNT